MRLAVLLAATVLAAHAAETGRVFVYSTSPMQDHPWMTVSCDGENVAAVKRGTYFVISVPAGQHTIASKDAIPTSVDVRSGEDVFVRVGWREREGSRPISIFMKAAPEQAAREMKLLGYIEPKKIVSPSVLKADPREPVPVKLKRR